jgi:alkylation response protein AidB-like acyl-CoA dehydrogenase
VDLALTPEQVALAAAARAAFAAGERPPIVAGPLTDLVVVARELGRAAVPSTFHTDVLAHLLGWRGSGLTAVALDLTAGPDLETSGPTGAATAAAATPPTGAGSLAGEGGPPGLAVVSGVCDFVAHGAVAEKVLVVVGEDRVVEVDVRGDGVEVQAQVTIGGDDRGRVTLDRAPVVAGWTCDVAGARARAAVVLAADAVGAAEGALDAAVAHVKERRQWGAPLGTLQAVQHRAADMLIDVTLAADAVLDAAGIADRAGNTEGTEGEVRLAAAYAKATAIERCRRVTAAAHQLAGGQGILADRPFHRWYRRVKAAEPELGDARRHRSTIAAALLDEV